ncbi:MAG: hypothetical protein AAB152_02220 [Candidatus Coatesbacteria bacterium]
MNRRSVALLLCLAVLPVPARSDCILDVWPGATVAFDVPVLLFPNWVRAPTAGFMLYECDDLLCPGCTASNLTGVTMFNYGTATGSATGDVTGLYFSYVCGTQTSVVYAMTYAGVWTVGASNLPAWTWAGSLAISSDPCDTKNGCWCYPSILVYSDIGSCPTDGASVVLGPGFSSVGEGGVSDSCGCRGPTDSFTAPEVRIGYVMKSCDPRIVAPGDAINYTIYYGKPGTPNVSNLTITDTQPPYTHWNGVASPNPDPGWDPNPGPPARLQWTIAGPLATGGGATGAITFQLTADWGNGESFEPGSGDVAAPEGEYLRNYAQMSWANNGCTGGRVSNGVATVIRRYLMWMIGDNDVLFASAYGQPPDEMVYSMFIKNMSTSKTWWNVSVWDTVPAEVDVWGQDSGFEDPCAGWTMTPSGCSSGSPGRVLAGPASTILTWKLDMPPQATMQLRWKAKVTSAAPPGSTAINNINLLELGRSGVVGGTGHQGKPKNFVHLAAIMLRTTYISFAGIGGGGLGKRGLFLTFYPLNRATDFQLRAYEAPDGDPWVNAGGVSQPISANIGTCTGGFTCSAGFAGGLAGSACKAERIPADYSCFSGGTPGELAYGYASPCSNMAPSGPCSNVPAGNYHHTYKIISNSPVLWQLFTCDGNNAHTFTPSTSLSFSGFMHYAFERGVSGQDDFNIMNTSVDPYGVLQPDLATTVHFFTWDFGILSWKYQSTYEIDKESHVGLCDLPVCNVHVRFISSSAKLVIRQSKDDWTSSESNWDAFSPSRNDGALTMDVSGEAMYIFPNMKPGYLGVQAIVTNMGAVNATYRIEVYRPFNTVDRDACVPPWMADFSGSWSPRVTHSVAAGFAAWGASWSTRNPHIYGTEGDMSFLFMDPPAGTGGIYRLVLISGGPIEVDQGASVLSLYGGGSLMHPADPGNPRPHAGTDFWLGMGWQWAMSAACDTTPANYTYVVDIFCPKAGMVVKETTSDNAYSATYTTTLADQDVAFRNIAIVPSGGHRIVRFQVTGGNAIAMYNECQPSHKFFTAPFVQVGTHYTLITPPVAFVGQSFWITVVVTEVGGGTKCDYTGTISFTSTDPGAKVETTPMDAYNYTWGAGDCGIRIFLNVTMTRLGLQTIIAADTADGSVTGLSTLNVVGVDVRFTKEPRLAVAASGDTVRFRLCWSNYSSGSAFTFVVTDAVPAGTTFVPEASAAWLDCGNTDGVSLGVSYTTATTPTMPGPASFSSGNPVAGTRWLRWTIPVAGVYTSGCACFRVGIN